MGFGSGLHQFVLFSCDLKCITYSQEFRKFYFVTCTGFFLHLNCMHVSELYAGFRLSLRPYKGYRGFESPFFLAGVILFSFIFSWFTRATKHCQGLVGLPLVDCS